MFKKAFTFIELLLCLGIIGIIAALMLFILGQVVPQKSKLAIKREYSLIESSIYSIINDNSLYPVSNSAESNVPSGFAYVEDGDRSKSGENFCQNFSDKLDTKGIIRCGVNKSSIESSPNATFTTVDGAKWYLTNPEICDPTYDDDCDESDKDSECTGIASCVAIIVDYNGSDPDNSFLEELDKNIEIDRMRVVVTYDGHVLMDDQGTPEKSAVKYIKSNSMYKGE